MSSSCLPSHVTKVQVALGNPNGGHISASIPPYNSGWDVCVDTNGIIDGQ